MGLKSDEVSGELHVKMKIFYNFLFFFSFAAFGNADLPLDLSGSGACYFGGFAFDLQKLVNSSKCIDPQQSQNKGLSAETCDCLENEATDNLLVKSQMEIENDKYKNDVEKVKQGYRNRFADVLEKMTLGAGIQSEILGLNEQNESEKVVGCDPSEFSTNVSRMLVDNIEIQNKALDKLLAKAEKDMKTCQQANNCSALEAHVKSIKDNKNVLNKKSPCNVSLGLLKKEDALKDLDEMRKHYSQKKDYEQLCIIDYIKTYTQGQTPNDCGGKSSCQVIQTFFSKTKASYQAAGSESAGSVKNCEPGDVLCLTIDQFFEQNGKNAKRKYAKNEDECISRAEFETFKGMPGEKLLNAISDAKNGNEAAEFLSVKNLTESDLDQERIHFLRSNPILAKMASSGNMKTELGDKLKQLADKIKNIDPTLSPSKAQSQKFKDYLAFMKNDVGGMLKGRKNLKKVKMNNKFVCETLQQNFTAIEIANDLPEVDDGKKKIDDINLSKAVEYCAKKTNNQSSTTNIAATLALSPLFTLGEPTVDKELSEKEFKDLKDDICSGYNQDYAAKNCDSKLDEDCRKKYLLGSPQTEATAIADNQGSVAPNLTPDQIQHAMRDTETQNQDTEFKNWYEKNVSSKMSKNVIATRGQEENFVFEQQKNNQIFSSAKVPESLNSGDDSNGSSPSLAKSSTNSNSSRSQNERTSGQQIPDYANDRPLYDPSKLANAKVPQDIIPGFNKMPLDTQKQSLNDVKDFISSQDNSPFDTEDVDEEIKKVDKKIVEKDAKRKTAIASDSQSPIINPSAAASFTTSNAPRPSPSSSFNSASFGGGGLSRSNASGAGKPSTVKDPNKLMNDALVKSNEYIQKNQIASADGRSPASLTATGSVNFLKGFVDPSTLKPGLLIHEEVLIPYSHDEYEKVKSNLDNLKKYLAENIDVSQIKGSKVYRIKDPQASPESFILFYVSVGDTGSINVKTIDRKKTLKNLNNNFR